MNGIIHRFYLFTGVKRKAKWHKADMGGNGGERAGYGGITLL